MRGMFVGPPIWVHAISQVVQAEKNRISHQKVSAQSFLAKAIFCLIPPCCSSNYHQITKAQEIKGKTVSPQRISCFLIAPQRWAAASRCHQMAGTKLSSSALMKLRHYKVDLSSGISSCFLHLSLSLCSGHKGLCTVCSWHTSGSAYTMSMTCQKWEMMKEEEGKSPQALSQGQQ